MKRSIHPSSDGFSLVVALIILVLLSILVVSFITTSTLERTTARAFVNKAAAEIAAQTATNQAMSLLTEKITKFPDSATVWEPLTPASGYPFEGTVLYFTEHTNDNDERNDPAATRRLLPLVSRGLDSNGQLLGEVAVADKATAQGPDAWTDDNSLDLNRARSNGDTSGWIGAPSDGRRPFRARWIEEKAQTGNPAVVGKTIARYAFWVEDESFKVNLNLLDNNLTNTSVTTGRASETAEWKRIDKTQPLPPQIAGLVPIQGLLRSAHAPYAPTDLDEWAGKLRAMRSGWFGKQLFELRAFNHAGLSYTDASTNEVKNYPVGDGAKFLATIYSGGLNMSRHGTQRVNLNGLSFEKPLTATSPSDADILKGIEQVVETIKYHAPKFGQRFYRNSDPSVATGSALATILNADTTVPAAHANIYLHKVAANIRDYIDPDSQPTVLLAPTGANTQPTVAPRVTPVLAMSAHDGANDYWAQGKDGAPFIQEAMVRFRSSCDDSTKRYNLKVDYYIEVWNMTDRDIYAKTQTDSTRRHLNDAFVKIADPVGWFGHGGGVPTLTADNAPTGNPSEGRDVVIDLGTGVLQGGGPTTGTAAPDGVVFKAGACTVITTDPDDLLPYSAGSGPGNCYTTGGVNKANMFYCPKFTGKREFAGPVPNQTATPASNRCDGIWPQFRDNPKPTNQDDYGTEVIFGNALGYIDSNPYTIAKGGGPLVAWLKASNGKTSRDDTYGGTLFGNGNSPSSLGDPRTNNEQLIFTRWNASGTTEPDQTRYYNPTSTDTYRFSLGWPNSRYVFPDGRNMDGTVVSGAYLWRDYYKVWGKTKSGSTITGSLGDSPDVPNPSADSAPAYVANDDLKSIGQLGDVFDPARVIGNGTLPVSAARGGGRTFKIGQKDDLVDLTTATGKSQQWASSRLTDFFDVSNDLYMPGLININGVRRDNGAALRAACYGLVVKAVSQAPAAAAVNPAPVLATLNSQEAATAGLQKVIDQAVLRLKNDPVSKPSCFRERGELGDLDVFSAASTDLLKKDSSVSGSADVKMSDSFDRTREELFRRLAGMITTRGNIFSVYAVGQSITEGNDAKKTLYVTGEHWVKTTFALLPKKADGTDFQTKQEIFIPDNATSRATRFAKPDHYDIQLLQVTTP